MLYVYHGTSSKFAEDIIKNGFKSASKDDAYMEIRDVLSKYINPNILTNEFFIKYHKDIISGNESNLNLRTAQTRGGIGPFVCKKDYDTSATYRDAPTYAHLAVDQGCGELEEGLIQFLNSLESAKEAKSELYELVARNVKPEFKDKNGKLHFTKPNKITEYPILFKIKINSIDDISGGKSDGRIKYAIGPNDIEGVAFLPLKYDWINHSVPELDFLSPDDFLKTLDNFRKNPENASKTIALMLAKADLKDRTNGSKQSNSDIEYAEYLELMKLREAQNS